MTMMTTSSRPSPVDSVEASEALAEAVSPAEDSEVAEVPPEEEAPAEAGKRDGNVSLFLWERTKY